MWDPRTYEDTDYGLDEGETFEPDFDVDDEPFDAELPHVMTVLGPIEPEELGVCIPATRILPLKAPNLTEGQRERAQARALAEAAEELEAFASVGGRGVVDIATARTGRDIAAIQRLTQRVPSHLVVAAGLPSDDRDPIANLRRECMGGLDDSGINAGLVVLDASTIDDALVKSGLDVAREHGMPALVTLERWSDTSRILAHRETPKTEAIPSLILAGPAGFPDERLLATASGSGAIVVIEAATDATFPAEQVLATRLVAAIKAGFGESLLVTVNLVSKRLPVAAPTDPRALYLIDRLAIAMMEAGASAHDVRQLMIENPARALTIFPGRV